MANLTLRDVANIIKTNDSEIIGNQDEQTEALKSIDTGIKKFLSIQEGRKLDDLEDRRERKTRLSALAAGGLGAAAMDSSSGGLSNFVKGLGLGTILTGAIGLLFKPIKSLFNKLSDGIGRLIGTERGKLLTENDALKSRLRDLDTKFKADIKTLKVEANTLKTEIANQKRIEAELKRQHAMELKSKDAEIRNNAVRTQKNLETAQARRAILESELKTANAELKATKNALRETKAEMSAARRTPKVDGRDLAKRVAATSGVVNRLEGVSKTPLSAQQFREMEAQKFGTNLKNLTYDTPSGSAVFKQVLPNGQIQFEGKFGPKGRKTTFAISPDKLNDLQKIQLFGTTDVTPASLKAFNRFARVVDVATLDPLGVTEAAAAGTSAVASRMGATTLAARAATLASTIARLNPAIIAFYATGGIKSMGRGMPSDELATLISNFLRLLFQNKPLKEILEARRKIHNSSFFTNDDWLLVGVAKAIGAYDDYKQQINPGSADDIEQVTLLLVATPEQLGQILLQLHKGSAKFYEAYEEYVSNADNMQQAISEIRSNPGFMFADKGTVTTMARLQLNKNALMYAENKTGLSALMAASPTKMSNIRSLATGQYYGGEFGTSGSNTAPPINMINTDNSQVISSSSMITNNGPAVDIGDFMLAPNPLTGFRGAMGF